MADRDLLVSLLIRAKDETTSVLEKIGGAFASLGRLIAEAVKSAVDFQFPSLGASVRDAEKLEEQMGQLRAAIEATGGAAGLTAEDIVKMSKDLDEATLGSAEGFRNAALQLLTFKSVGIDAFERTLKAAQDLSSAGFGAVEGTVVQLGKALENPIQGLTALTRVGVSFTEEQKKMIEAFVALGDVAGAQNIVLEAVEGQVQGVAAAAGGGLAGAVDLVGKRMTDLRETIGGVLLPVFARLNLVWADVIGAVNATAERLAGPLKNAAQEAGQALRTLGEGVAAFLSDALSKLGDWIGNLDWASLHQGAELAKGQLQALWQRFVDLGTATQTFGTTARLAFNGVQVAFNSLVGGLQALVSGFVAGLAVVEEAAAKVGLGTLERAAELRARAEEWKTYAQESAAAIARDAGQAGAALDRLTGSTDDAAAAQARLKAALPTAELQTLNRTVDDYRGLAARAAEATHQAARDLAIGKISAADYGQALLGSARAQEDLTAAQERQAALDTAARVKDEASARIVALAALTEQLAATEEESKALGQADQAKRRLLESEIALAEAKGATATASRLARELAQLEAEQAATLATLKAREAEQLSLLLEKKREQLAAQKEGNADLLQEIELLALRAAAAQQDAKTAEVQAELKKIAAQNTAQAAEKTAELTAATENNSAATEKNAAATETAAKSYTKMEDAAVGALRELSGLSAGMNALISTMLRVDDIGASFGNNFRGELGKLNLQLEQTNQAIEHNQSIIGPYSDAFERNVNVANAARKAYLEQAIAATELAGRLKEAADGADTGTRALQNLIREGAGAVDGMTLLDQATLDNLRGELEAANARLRDMQDEARSASEAIAELNAEIAAEKGDDATARRLELELDQRRRLAEIEKNLEQARAAGNRELIALYEQQRQKLEELGRLKAKNLDAELKGEGVTRRTQSTLSGVADEAERAASALTRVGAADLSKLMNQSRQLNQQFADLNQLL